MDTARESHSDEHTVPVASPHLHPEQFKGVTSLGGVFDRTGGVGGTSMSENAHNVAGSLKGAVSEITSGNV